MSQLNINRNTFLEREELNNFQSFLASSLLKNLLMQATYSYGIVTNNPGLINPEYEITGAEEDSFNNPFEVQQGTNTGTIQVLPGMAFTSSGNIINTNLEDNIQVPNDSAYYWVKIAHTTRNYELGLVSVNTKGVVSGTVDFTGKVRGQSSSTPVSIRFEKSNGDIALNNGIYQIVNVIDNQNLNLTSATSFVAESNLRVIILGTLPLGGMISQEQRNGLYTYDYYTISLIAEGSAVDTPPNKEKDEYYIARVCNVNGTISIDNTKKSEFWSLGNFKMPEKTEGE